ncbi:copper resistance CopC family protein [Saccharomonospora halophila]|uniref:copper resistance CopC family protein n=1 Tax=Saccharomonospora halophila TaxID=129922 RepID=UPI0003666BB5
MPAVLAVALVGALTTLTVLVGAPPAAAHNVLISSDPADGDRLATAPEAVTLTFDQPVQDAGTNEVAVTGPDGEAWAEGTVTIDGAEATAPLRPLGPAGEYVIGFRVLSADGHPVSDEIRFTLTEPGPAAGDTGGPGTDGTAEGDPPPPSVRQVPDSVVPEDPAAGDTTDGTADDDPAGVPVWVWVIGAAALLVIGLGVALRMGRSHED